MHPGDLSLLGPADDATFTADSLRAWEDKPSALDSGSESTVSPQKSSQTRRRRECRVLVLGVRAAITRGRVALRKSASFCSFPSAVGPANPTSITKIIERLIRARNSPTWWHEEWLTAELYSNCSFRAEREREKELALRDKCSRLPFSFL